MNLKGFTSDQYVRYSLNNNNINDYISEIERWKTRRINGRYNVIFDDKLLFYKVFNDYIKIPRNLAWINYGHIYDLDGNFYTDDQFMSLLDSYNYLIVKPVIGGGGKGVSLLISKDGLYKINMHVVDRHYLIEFVKRNKDMLVCEFIQQHEYSNNLYDKTVNTMRIVTLFDDDYGEAKIVKALHRIGTKKTIPVDNVAKGGLVSQIDLETGMLGEAKTYFDTSIYTNHPDSGTKIVGTHVPFWAKVKGTLLLTAKRFPYIKFVAWDVVITKDGFTVIEGNASTGLDLIQLWSGARNTELGIFYKKHGVVK